MKYNRFNSVGIGAGKGKRIFVIMKIWDKFKTSKIEKKDENKETLVSLASKKSISSKDDEDFKKYFIHLDDGLENPNNHNIAITGKYGSGKSTIIDSYLKERNNSDFLKVSLAAFSLENSQKIKNLDEKGEDVANSKKAADGTSQETNQIENKLDSNNAKLEQSIINQILYQINYKKIPLTNFKIKLPIKLGGRILFLFEFLNIILVIVSKLGWLNLSKTFKVHLFQNIFHLSLESILLFTLICFVSINVWAILKHIQFKNLKISFKNIDANLINIEDDDNLFEKYIDEIVYLFQSSGKHILIIEDIDRFNNLKIFQQLRELNIKLNNTLVSESFSRTTKTFSKIINFLSHKNKNKVVKAKDKKWTFVYLLRDDIFSDPNDRVKFFDLIIPVVPYVTTTNSAIKLKNLFRSQHEKIDEKLFDILGTYIGDYRLLQNIYNEFLIFKFKLKDKDINQLLALVAYKNVSPDHFDDLQNGHGDLKKVTENFRNEFLVMKESKLNKKRELKKFHLESRSQNEKELILILLLRSGESTVRSTSYYSGDIEITQKVDQFIDGTAFNLKVGNEDKKRWTYEDLIKSDYYIASIHDSTNEISYENKIQKLDEEIKKLSTPLLKNIDRSFWDKYIVDDLLFALIKNGYIDEHYLDIINNSYGSRQNEMFKKNLYSEGQDDITKIDLTDIDHLVKTLYNADFGKKQILNFGLFHYIITSAEVDKRDIMFSCATQDKNNFIESFLNIYPDDFNTIVEISHENIKLALLELEGNANLEKILMNNMYEDNRQNLECAINYLINLNYSENELCKYLKSDMYRSLKTLIIKEISKPTNVNEIPDLELLNDYLDFDKLICSSTNINQYLESLNSLKNDALRELPLEFINFINRNFHKFSFDAEIEKVFYELIAQSEDVNDNAIITFFEKYPESYPLFGAEWLNKFTNKAINALVSKKLLERDFDVLKGLENKGIAIDRLFDIDEIIQIFSSENYTTSDINILYKISERQPTSEAGFKIFVQSVSAFDSREKQLLDIFGNFVSIDSDCRKFKSILSTYQEKSKEKGITSYRFSNTEENGIILEWFKNQKIIVDVQETDNNKLKVAIN